MNLNNKRTTNNTLINCYTLTENKKVIVDFLKALTDETRLEIIELLQEREMTAGEIEELLQKSQSTISQHLSKLVNNSIIKFEKKNNIKHYLIGNNRILNLINNINSIVLELSREKFIDLRDLDIKDTLS